MECVCTEDCAAMKYKDYYAALGVPRDADLDQIKKASKNIPGVLATEKCHVRKTGMKLYVDLHLIVGATISVKEGHTIAHNLKDHLKIEIPEIADVLIHVEPDN